MKMILANTDDAVSSDLSDSLIQANYRVTHLAATGGFLRGGATTLMIGVEDELVEEALKIIRQYIKNHPNYEKDIATIYVLDVNNYNRLFDGTQNK